MKPFDNSSSHRPFKNLKALLDGRNFKLSNGSMPYGRSEIKRNAEPDPGDERRLFLDAMADVDRIRRDKHIAAKRRAVPPIRPKSVEETNALSCLEKIVKTGEGFIIALTPEYIAGSGENVHPEIIRRLHQGRYAIQDHIDLHGFNVSAAREAFHEFMKSCTMTGKQGVLIVHGRGLSSAAEPVLKSRVIAWLTSGYWRKWIIAYCSARSCDGGAGATYVLLRTHRPTNKGMRKKRFKRFIQHPAALSSS
jgi:DNA-nicking Smr family endonuclease